MTLEIDDYNELCAYTLTHGAVEFIHQYVVDAWGAQQAKETEKPIRVVFSLAGLHLHLDRKFTGREVQLAHMWMARRRKEWPRWPLPAQRGAVTARDVMRSPEGADRDAAIDRWCASVWEAYRPLHGQVQALLKDLELPDDPARLRR